MYSIKINNETLITIDFGEVNGTLLTFGPNVDIRTYTDFYNSLDDKRKNAFMSDCNYLSMEHVHDLFNKIKYSEDSRKTTIDFYVNIFKKFCDKYKEFKLYKDGWLFYSSNKK